ncbi:hypothetical protein [Rhizobium sp. BK251]|uniref:hypothetical protein n=1 Tax=Rhizobium sp. BK251 TaxID=2512125 RepID=UPI00104A9117|nr:hypothetical protein [Rhizobium sp. BK251]TCL73590.1 hypothetical protein EV286_103119 [Rhizobium sp. BK251]
MIGKLADGIAACVLVCLGTLTILGMVIAISGGIAGSATVNTVGIAMIRMGIIPAVILLFTDIGQLLVFLPFGSSGSNASSRNEEANLRNPASKD